MLVVQVDPPADGRTPHAAIRLGHPYVDLGQHDRARAVWREALELYRAQHRTQDANRVRHQLDELGD